MANSKSAEKRVRQIKKRTEANRAIQSRVKTLRKKILTLSEEGDHEGARKMLSEFSSAVDKAAKRNVFKKNKAANLKSRTNALLKAKAAA